MIHISKLFAARMVRALPYRYKVESLEAQIQNMASSIQMNYRMNAAIAERIWDARMELAELKLQKAEADFAHYLRTGRFPDGD